MLQNSKSIFRVRVNNQFRTPETHLLFELTKRKTGLYENKKSGTLSQNEMDSALVELAGIEPASKQGK